MMTRKHFREVANILSSMTEGKEKKRMIDSYVVMFSRFNPRFDEDRFREACKSP